jgi:hypothetical protein
MKPLNELYNNNCKPGYKNYQKLSHGIVLIDNFFENFELAKDFFLNREKWICIEYQDHSKPGYETIFPNWVGKSLIEKYILSNKLNDDLNSYKILCNFFYDNQDYIWSLSNSNYFPHIDSVQIGEILNYICLINLNECPVSTKFYSYKNNFYIKNQMENEWNNYKKDIQNELLGFYSKKNITRDEIKQFLDKKQNLDIKLINNIEYNPNQAIIYPANFLHSPNVTKQFTKDNPRCILRISFDIKLNNINYA